MSERVSQYHALLDRYHAAQTDAEETTVLDEMNALYDDMTADEQAEVG